MSKHRKRHDTHARADDTARGAPARPASSLLQRLLQKVAGSDEQAGDDASLQPEGRRSGKGARSIAPYLEATRNSRPGPLE
jgi:hypothetical protein